MEIRPEAERKLRAGFQQRVERQNQRYAAELARAGQLAVHFEFGEVTGVFTAQAGGGTRPGTLLKALLPLGAIPVLIIGAAASVPGVLPLLGAFPFLMGAWFGLSLWRGREPRRPIWFFAFTEGFILQDTALPGAGPARWDQITGTEQVWSEAYSPAAEESRPVLTAYRLRTADGQAHEITRKFKNVQDPYPDVGPLLKGMVPAAVGKTFPAFPTIDEVIAKFAKS